MVFLEHRPRVYNALTTVVEATALFVRTCTAKGAMFGKHVTAPHGKENGRSIPDDSERSATVALPTAASAGFISG